jgi:hypothetical protein
MTTIRQLIQTTPAKANELLTKLADTSETAIKTRDSLFSDLKAELELVSTFEEQHLFPVLRKYKETKDLVAEALTENKRTRKLVSELEQTPRESEDFSNKVIELKKAFQQHVRDELKELLPAVVKVLSDEDAQAIVERIEAEKAELGETKRAETEQRRAEARRQRDQAGSAERSAENMADAARAGAKGARQAVRTAQGGATSGLTEIGHLSADQLEAMAQASMVWARAGTVVARGLLEISREWSSLAQDRWQRNLEGMRAVVRSGSVQDLFAMQSGLARDNLLQAIDNSRRIAELSVRVAAEATQTIKDEASTRRQT